MISWIVAAALAVTSPMQYDMRCTSSYMDRDAPMVDNDSRYSIDLDRKVWCLTKQCRVEAFYDVNEAELVLLRGFALERSTGIIRDRQFNVDMQCRKVEFTPMPVNEF